MCDLHFFLSCFSFFSQHKSVLITVFNVFSHLKIALEELAGRVNGDMRMALNQLQYMSLSMSVIKYDDIRQRLQSSSKDEDISPFAAVDKYDIHLVLFLYVWHMSCLFAGLVYLISLLAWQDFDFKCQIWCFKVFIFSYLTLVARDMLKCSILS